MNNSRLEIFDMVIASILIDNKDEKSWYYKKSFLLTDISMDVAFRILFITQSNVNVNFTH